MPDDLERLPEVAGVDLPSELTSFIGRGRELADLRSALESARLVTLTGPAGSGKSRLALAAARSIAGEFPDGAFVCELGSESDSSAVTRRVASALGLQENATTSAADLLVARLAGSAALLVIDSCEHLVDECATLASYLLRKCPRVVLVATSQEPLGVAGELVKRVPPLSLPVDGEIHRATESEAVQLFVERCRAVDASFRLTHANSRIISNICIQLDGIPLAIELAAARIRLLGPDEILRRLEDRFTLLIGGSRTAMARHQTLRAAVAWSYDQLSDAEKRLFCRLSVFSSGFTVDAAEAICSTPPLTRPSVLETLEKVGDRAMLLPATSTGVRRRHRVLETLRQYGAERLAEQPDEADMVRELHCGYYLDLSRDAGRRLASADYVAGATQLEEEADNIRSALAWGVPHHPTAAMEAIAALRTYWMDRGSLTEGRRWASSAIAASADVSAPRGEVLYAAAGMAWDQADTNTAHKLALESLNVALVIEDQRLEAKARGLLGILANDAGNVAEATAAHHRALELWRLQGDSGGVATALNNRALIAYDTDNLAHAVDLVNDALRVAEPTGNKKLLGGIHESYCRIETARQDFRRAAIHASHALTYGIAIQSKPLIATVLEDVVSLVAIEGDSSCAVVLAGAASAIRAEIGCRQPQRWRSRYSDQLKLTMRSAGGSATRAWERGTALAMADAAAQAMEKLTVLARAEAPNSQLTRRQVEITRLIAAGLTNRQIAIRLSISARTADAHVDHIMRRLDVHSRAQIAAWAAGREPVAALTD